MLTALVCLHGCAKPTSRTMYALSNPIAAAFVCREFRDGKWSPAPLDDCTRSDPLRYRLMAFVANGPAGEVSITDLYLGSAMDMNAMIPGHTGVDVGTYVLDVVARRSSDRVIALDSADQTAVFMDPADGTFIVLDLEEPAVSLAMAPDDSYVLVAYPASGRIGRIPLDDEGMPAADEEFFQVGGSPLSMVFSPDGRLLVGNQYEQWIAVLDAQSLELETRIGLVPECMDGLDNDGDGLTDRDDPDCLTPGTFREAPPADCGEDCAPPVTRCNDGIDNDGDGLTDMEDPGCTDRTDNSEWTDLPQCSDGIDNDGDGLTDYPDDPDCLAAADPFEGEPLFAEGTLPECANDMDDDGDGLVDSDDPDCLVPYARESSDFPCADGIDNDLDGWTDFPDDPGCFSAGDTSEAGLASPMTRLTVSDDGRWIYATHRGLRQVSVLDLWEQRLIDINEPDDAPSRRMLRFRGQYAHMFSSAPVGVSLFRLEETVYAVVTLEGSDVHRIVVERDGEPVHQIEQAASTGTPQSTAGKPTLSVEGKDVQMGYAPAPGFPNLGPLLIESLPEGDGKSYYGIRFNEDVRTHLGESWYIEYEGAIPHLGRATASLVSSSRVTVSGIDLCRLGALPGDVFSLVPGLPNACEEFAEGASFDYVIKEVHSDWLELDADSGFRIVDGEVQALPALRTVCFPYPVEFRVRPQAAFTVWGARTGYLHNVRAAEDGCVEDPDGDPLFAGRVRLAEIQPEVTIPACPITREFEGLTVYPFANPVFTLQLFPGCQTDLEGVISAKAPTRGTRWRFDVRSGFTSNTISGGYFPVFQSLSPIEGFVYLLDLAGRSIKVIEADLFKVIYSYY
jgi:hypothetical protein